MEQVSLGIEGAEHLIERGIIRGNAYLLKGAPGTGKTTFGIQFIYNGALKFNEPGIILTFEQFPQQLYTDSLKFGWDLKEMETQNRLRVLFSSPSVLLDSSNGNILRSVVNEIGAKRIYVDSLAHIKSADSRDPSRVNIYRILNLIKGCGLTALFADEENANSQGFEDFLFDGVIRLSYKPYGVWGRGRTIEVIKSRGQGHLSGEHSFHICDKGIVVYPHLTVDGKKPDFGDERVSLGVSKMDKLLGGGLLKGTSCVVSGASGLGKSLLGMQFLAVGAQKGENGLYVSIEEHPEDRIRFSRGFSFNFPNLVSKGLISFLYRAPVDLDFYELSCAIRKSCEEKPISRLLFDSVSTLAVRIAQEQQFRDLMYLLVDYLKSRGITILLTDETRELFEQPFISTHGISSIVDTAILMRYVEVNARMYRVFTILKSRGTPHSKDVVSYEISKEGIVAVSYTHLTL
ncbi:MAG: hypothetical protein N2234_10515, partial [Planctomycetota bacterium]|nr:hypothetical protein [Planctomycetota bacterium]